MKRRDFLKAAALAAGSMAAEGCKMTQAATAQTAGKRITVADTTGKSQVKEEKVEYAFEWLSDADRNDRVRQRPATELPPPADRTHAVPAMRYATVHPQRPLRDGRTGTVLLELQVGTDGEVLDAD